MACCAAGDRCLAGRTASHRSIGRAACRRQAARSGGLGQRSRRAGRAGVHGKRRVPVLPSRPGRRHLADQQAQSHDSRAPRPTSRPCWPCAPTPTTKALGRRGAIADGRHARPAVSQALGRPTARSTCFRSWPRSAAAAAPRLETTDKPHWDTETFATACAGCHTTAVDPETHAFATVSLDCFTCHGDAPGRARQRPQADAAGQGPQGFAGRGHLDLRARATFASASRSRAACRIRPTSWPATICSRTFRSTSARPTIPKLNPADRHVLENVRDVVLFGQRIDDLPELPRRAHRLEQEASRPAGRASRASTATTPASRSRGTRPTKCTASAAGIELRRRVGLPRIELDGA